MVEIDALNEKIKKHSQKITSLKEEIKKVIVGQSYLIERLLVVLLSNGHVLLEGVPGLAKTLTIRTISNTIKSSFSRLQFTPDLLPSDIIGTMIYNQKTAEFRTKQGPVFANIVLADEINRSPAKVQSALLEAMQERQVTIGESTMALPSPFFVLATQNPIEQEGTYPLPEAQIDRFMLKVKVDYPSKKEEKIILDALEHKNIILEAKQVLTVKELLHLQSLQKEIYIDDKLKQYIVDIVSATREPAKYGLSKIKNFIEFGASPRASIFLMHGAKSLAFLNQRGYVIPDDIKALIPDVLRHRIMLSYEAEAEFKTVEDIIKAIVSEIEVP